MAIHKLTDAKIYIAQYDVTGQHNMIEVPWSSEPLDSTTFGQTTRIHTGGLFNADIKGQGFVSYGTGEVEAVLNSKLALQDTPISIAAEGGDATERMYFTQALVANLKPMGGTVGDLHGFTFDAKPSNAPLVPGQVFAAKSARTSSSNSGTAVQLGAVSATQRVYAALHVFTVSGTSPTLDVTVNSDNGVGFASPITRVTFTQATAATSQFTSAAGAITDDYWRVDWTIGGSATPTFTFAVVVGIF